MLINGVDREPLESRAHVDAVGLAEDARIRPAVREHADDANRAILVGVSGRVVPARAFGAARTAVEAGVPQERKRVREGLRIVLRERIELQRVVPADRELAVHRVGEAAVGLPVERLAATAAVGVCRLLALRYAAVEHDAVARIDQLRGQRVEAGLEPADDVEAEAGRLIDPDADLGLLQAAFGQRRLGTREIPGRRKGLIFQAAEIPAVERNAVGLIGVANVDRGINGDAAQREAVRQRVLLGPRVVRPSDAMQRQCGDGAQRHRLQSRSTVHLWFPRFFLRISSSIPEARRLGVFGPRRN